MPRSPWIMTQSWHDLLFAHWPVDAQLLAAKVPSSLTLDLFEGRGWLGIVPFWMTNVAPRGVPALPWLSAFPELNVRTYVRLGDRPGVFFFSLDASNPLAVLAARTLFHLPYFAASMRIAHEGKGLRYSSRRLGSRTRPAKFMAGYGPTGSVFEAVPGTLEYFLTERYCLHTVDRAGRPLTVEIHHPPWPLQSGDAEIAVNTMTEPIGLRLDQQPLLHFSRRQDIVAWAPVRTHSPMRR
jgi:uncharacterized protein YqjF (DUF2071 family)